MTSSENSKFFTTDFMTIKNKKKLNILFINFRTLFKIFILYFIVLQLIIKSSKLYVNNTDNQKELKSSINGEKCN